VTGARWEASSCHTGLTEPVPHLQGTLWQIPGQNLHWAEITWLCTHAVSVID
jgi:hypothetical protein